MSAPSTPGPPVYRRVGEYVVRAVSGQIMLVPIRSGVGDLDSMFSLNEVGGRIWALLEQGRTSEEISAALCTEYDVTAEEARRDVASFLASLAEAGAVEQEKRP